MERLDLPKIKDDLEAQRTRIMQQIAEIRQKSHGTDVINPDRDDLAYHYVSAEMQTAELTRLEERLIQVESAIEQINDGQYGVCKRCGKTINPARLRAIPYALLCIKCQELIS